MADVTGIEWTVVGAAWGRVGEGPVRIEVFRDGRLLKRLRLDPAALAPLERGERVGLCWRFRDPDGVGVAVSGTPVPDSVPFPDGVAGHLRVRMTASAPGAWDGVEIHSEVTSGALRAVPGTAGAVRWVEEREWFRFGVDALDREHGDGVGVLTLRY